MSIKTFAEFRGNYSLKNGEIGDQETLNRPLDRLKREIDLISNFLKSSLGMPISDWNFNSFYEYESIVTFSDALYMSISDDNTGFQPDLNPDKWMVLPKMSTTNWDPKINYNAGDFVKFTDGLLYTSKANNNLGFSPGTRDDYWDELSTRFKYLKASHDMLIQGDSQLDGNTVIGTLGTSANRSLSILTNSDYTSKLSLYGQNNGSGQIFVGRDLFNGGGIEYYGTSLFDDTVPTAGADYLTLYRKFGGEWSWTARNKYTSDDWEFAGSIDINNNLNVDGQAIFIGDAPGSGLTTVRHDFEVVGTATFDGDIILKGQANFDTGIGVFGDIHVEGKSDLDGAVTTLDNVTLNAGLTNWTRIKGHTYAEGNMDVTGSTLARGAFTTQQGVTLNDLGGTTLIKGATTIDDTLKVNSTLTAENNVVLNNAGGTTTIKGSTTFNNNAIVQGRAYFDDGSANAAVFRGTSAQNVGFEFQTDGTAEWLLYRATTRDMILSARNYNNAGSSRTAMRVNWDTGVVDFPEQTYFQKNAGLAPFKVDSTTKVNNLNADMVDGLHTSISASANTIVARDASGHITTNRLFFESGDHSITTNDGKGNFNIRVGHQTDETYSDDGKGAIHVEFSHETTNPGLLFHIGENPTGKLAGDAVTFTNTLGLYSDGTLTWGGYAIPTAGSTGISTEPIAGFDGTGSVGSVLLDGMATGGYEGINIGGRAALIHDGVSTFGLYDDVNNEWMFKATMNSATEMFFNGASKIKTTSVGADVTGTLNSTSCRASTDMQAPIYYDSNNTSYFGDFASTSYLAYLGRRAHHTGHLVGSYNSVGENSYKSNPIYTIGSNYNPNDADIGNMYGIGYSHTNAAFIGTQAGGGWGLYVAADGDARIFLNGSTGVAYLTATSAYYADVAENYLADKVYAPGTVMGIGGENEITEWQPGLPLAGVVSTDPALQMNNGEEQAKNELYIPVALVGKIPCFVSSDIKKGQYLIADANGKAYGVDDYDFAQSKILIGVALEDSANGSVMVKV